MRLIVGMLCQQVPEVVYPCSCAAIDDHVVEKHLAESLPQLV